MRLVRRLFLLAILAILSVVGARYYLQRAEQIAAAPPAPASLPVNTAAAGKDWVYAYTVDDKPVVEIRAGDMRQIREPDVIQLDRVALKIFHKQGREYDQVESARAVFDRAEGALISEGEVTIRLAVPAEGPPRERLMTIRSSGVRFEEKTGKASTGRPASFEFDRGEGTSIGAEYDPATRELVMRSEVRLRWGVETQPGRVMEVEADSLSYREGESKIYLRGRSRLRRGAMTLEGEDAVVTLVDGEMRLVEARNAKGADTQPGRAISWSAERLTMHLGDKGAVEKLIGEGAARLESTSEAAATALESGRIDLAFEIAQGDSVLQRALAHGASRLESKPAARKGVVTPPSRRLSSEVIELFMRPGGEEVDRVETHTPGVVEFVSNHPSQRPRRIEGDRMVLQYAEANRLRAFRAVSVKTRTEGAPRADRKSPPPSITSSRDLEAEFEPRTGEMSKLSQWGAFRYEEGDRKASAESAVMDSVTGLISLEKNARLADAGGQASADRIVIDQRSGDYHAEGRVSSARLPDARTPAGPMLSRDEPVQSTSRRMTTFDANRRVLYEGDAVLWQGANRLQADRIEIDRAARIVRASGRVVSQFEDRQAGAKAPRFVVTRAPAMTYSESERMAHYTGGAALERGDVNVRAAGIRAYLKESAEGETAKGDAAKGDSGLDRAVAEGAVSIVQSAKDRTRRGAGERAEYFAEDERIVLTGGDPQFVDSRDGATRGEKLTWFANTGKLVVEGSARKPAESKIRRQ
jgi:lipopolysaccharide export system protein LptA